MRFLAVLTLIALGACSRAPMADNPESVPNIQQAIADMRGSGTYIYVSGGLNDGAAAGQTANFLITPDDTLICLFRSEDDFAQDGFETAVTGHRIQVSGAYAALASIVLPNVLTTPTQLPVNFTIEASSLAGVTTTTTNVDDPRFAPLTLFFATNPTPCWGFG